MKELFERPETSLCCKSLFFRAIQINLLLWGCESWALREDLEVKLERFVRKKIRKILKINMYDVMDRSMSNAEHYSIFNNFPTIQALVDTRRMKLLGKIVRDKVSAPARLLLIAFVPNPRTSGRPQQCNKESLVESLKRLFKDSDEIHIDHAGSMKDWYLDALDEKFWSECVARILNSEIPFPTRPTRTFNVGPRRSGRRKNVPSPKKKEKKKTRKEESHNRGAHAQKDGALSLLGLKKGANVQEIDHAYKKLSRIYHLDQHRRFADEEGRSTRTGLALDETSIHMQKLNSARESLQQEEQ